MDLYDRILIYHQAVIGDMIMAIPAMQAIRANFPNATIDLLAISGVKGSIQRTLIEPLNIFDHQTYIETYGSTLNRFIPRLKIITSMIRCNYPTVFMLTYKPLWYEYFFFQLAGVKNIISLADWSLKKGNKKANDVLLDNLANYGIPCQNFRGRPNLFFSKKEKEQGENIFNSLQVPPASTPILVGISGRRSITHYPLISYRNILNTIIECYNLFPIFIASPEEGKSIEEFQKSLSQKNSIGAILSANEDYTLRELICAMSHCKFYLGNDTGSIHLASLASLPCIGLYSSLDAGHLFYPIGQEHIILQNPPVCAGCNLMKCPKGTPPPCLTSIKEKDVIKAVEEIMAK